MIDAHRGAFEYDWRVRIRKPLRSVGRSMSWGEALRITEQLSQDPSTHVCTAIAGLDRPVSFHELMLMNVYDLEHQIAWVQGGKKGPRPKPFPRPWPDRKKEKMRPSVPQDVVVAALRSAGHHGPLPTA